MGMPVSDVFPYMVLVVMVSQFCLYCSELQLPLPRFSLKYFFVKHVRAIFFAVLVLSLIFLVIPVSSGFWRPLWLPLSMSPLVLIALRLGYQTLMTMRRWDNTILIIGSAPVAGLLKNILFYDRSLGFRALHFRWDLTSPDTLGDEWERLSTVVTDHRIKKIVIALNERRGQLPVDSLLNLRVAGVEIIDAVSFYEEISGKLMVQALRPSSLIFGEGFNRVSFTRVSKRICSIICASVGLILSIPIFVVFPVLIKLTSKGTVFYRQERVGERGIPFMLFKFRSMYEDAELTSGPVWAKDNDHRVTKIGKLMRTLRIDEIPQVINVLKGEMSFVGPRPERPIFVEQLKKRIPYYNLRFSVKPGITGWAQVKYRYGSSERDAIEKLQYDLYYIKHLSILLDLTIIFETLKVIVAGNGAR